MCNLLMSEVFRGRRRFHGFLRERLIRHIHSFIIQRGARWIDKQAAMTSKHRMRIRAGERRNKWCSPYVRTPTTVPLFVSSVRRYTVSSCLRLCPHPRNDNMWKLVALVRPVGDSNSRLTYKAPTFRRIKISLLYRSTSLFVQVLHFNAF